MISPHHRYLTRLALFPSLAVLLIGTVRAGDVEIVVPGDTLTINGATDIPRGLLGVHNASLTEERAADWGVELDRVITHTPDGTNAVIAGVKTEKGKNGKVKTSGFPKALSAAVLCLWDRYQPAIRITRKDWREYLAALGKAYGEQARTTGQQHYIEFWNEPYLNWATRPAVNYHCAYYVTNAVEAGKPMTLRTTGETIADLVWDRQVFFAFNKGNNVVDYVATGALPRDGEAGQTVKLRYRSGSVTLAEGAEVTISGPRILRREWSGRDVTQDFYWSGSVNRRFYLEMFEAFGRSLKETNPDVKLAAGWGFNMFNEEWESWNRLYRPTIDAAHDWFDALHEHHYGCDTRVVAASYEVAYAYTFAHYGKRISFWNTEAGGHLDPEQPGTIKPANEGDPRVKARAAMTYFLRDVIHLLAFCPDKALIRATHQPQENGGDEFAFKLLKPLRGRLLAATSSSPQVWTVASLSGDSLTLAVFNDANAPTSLAIRVTTPSGTTLRGITRREVAPDKGSGAGLSLRETDLRADGNTWSTVHPCGPKEAVVFTAHLRGEPHPAADQAWMQYPAGAVLLTAAATNAATFTIALPSGVPLAAAATARLRLVLSEHPDGLDVMLNGTRLSLLPGPSWIADHAIPATLLKAVNTLTITAPPGRSVLVAGASLYLETRKGTTP